MKPTQRQPGDPAPSNYLLRGIEILVLGGIVAAFLLPLGALLVSPSGGESRQGGSADSPQIAHRIP